MNKLGTFGFVKIQRTTGQFYDPVTGTQQGGDTVITGLVGVVLDTPQSLDPDRRLELGDRNVLLDNQFEPLMSDLLLIPDDSGNDVPYRITNIGGINHAGVRQFYSVTCSA